MMLSIKGEQQTRRYHYDANGNLTAQTDARNTPIERQQARALNPLLLDNTQTYQYDTQDQLTQSIHPQQQPTPLDDIAVDVKLVVA